MRSILVHDYAGHPFQVELSRALARRGHEVLHLHCAAYRSGKGAVDALPSDPATFSTEAVPLDRFDKYSWRRLGQEIEYGRRLARRIRETSPDVVISANTPILSQALARRAALRTGSAFVFWLQDIIGAGASQALGDRIPLGRQLARPLARLERRLVSRSDGVVAISDDFRSQLNRWGVQETVTVIENWAPLAELPLRPQSNTWSRRLGLDGKRVLLYAGTLGLKHNPDLLLELATHFRARQDVRVVVISEGVGADYLFAAARRASLDNLVVLPFQPFGDFANVMGSATVLVAILERGAGGFSVPSKVLSYLCAGRPILAALPEENLAARTLSRSGAAVVTDPDDTGAFTAAAELLLSSPE